MAYKDTYPEFDLPSVRQLRIQEGALYATDVSNRVSDALWSTIEPKISFVRAYDRPTFREHTLPTAKRRRLARMYPDISEDNPAASSLYVASRSFAQTIQGWRRDGPAFEKRFAISDHDKEIAHKAFQGEDGLSDINFTWYFAPLIASNVVDAFVEQGNITAEQHSELTLPDWANLIGSGWFGRLINDMAYTQFGTYINTGVYHSNYRQGSFSALQTSIFDEAFSRASDLFETDETFDPADGHTYITASLTPTYRAVLRSAMNADPPSGKQAASTGCPVARHVFSEDLENPHFRRLLASHNLVKIQPATQDGVPRYYQEYSAIDIALATLARKLDRYAHNYGTPVVSVKRNGKMKVKHQHLPASKVLCRQPQVAHPGRGPN